MVAIVTMANTPVSRYFTQSDVVVDSRTIGRNIDNNIYTESVFHSALKAARELDKLCDLVGPISIISWYRCEELEREVSKDRFLSWCNLRGLSVDSSAAWDTFFLLQHHQHGNSVDFKVVGKRMSEVYAAVKGNLSFDQLFYVEDVNGDYIHVSFDLRRRQLCFGEPS